MVVAKSKKQIIIFLDKPEIDFTKKADTGLVFFNPKSGVEMAFNFNDVLPFKNNPWYDNNTDSAYILDLFISEETSRELSEFCIKHCKSKLPFFRIKPGKLYLKDIDFLLRFWKRSNYYAKPSITLTGQNK